MDVVVERCAGLDVHRDTVVATVRFPEGASGGVTRRHARLPQREAGRVRRVRRLAQRKPRRHAGRDGGDRCLLAAGVLRPEAPIRVLAPQREHLRNAPDRKSDVLDSAWFCQLLEHGLVRPSSCRRSEVRRLRDLIRQPAQFRTRPCNPAPREGAAGRRDQAHKRRLPRGLLGLGAGSCSRHSWAGRDRPRAVLAQLVQRRDAQEDPAAAWEALAQPVRDRPSRHPRRSLVRPHRRARLRRSMTLPEARIDHPDPTARRPDRAALHDPRRRRRAAPQVLIAECGLDMTVFPTVGHFASWAGACPGHHESAGRRRSGRTRPGPALADRRSSPNARRAAVRTKGTYLAAHYAQLRGRRGEPKAIGAIRHDLLVAYFHIVRDQVPYRDLGPDWQRKRYSVEHRARRLQRQLEALGYAVTLDQLDQPAEQAA